MIPMMGWVTMAIAATTISAIASYRFLTMTCSEGESMCGNGTFIFAVLAFLAAMMCMGFASNVDQHRRGGQGAQEARDAEHEGAE